MRLRIIFIIIFACGSLLIPHRETSRSVRAQGGIIPLYPTFFLEMPKTEYSGTYTFQVNVITSGRLKIEVTDLYCDASCLFEMNPNGDVRQRLDPLNTSAGFPEGDTIFAEYDLEAGTDYTLTMEYFQHTSLFGGSELQYFVIRSIPEGYDGPIRSMMNGINPRLIDALSGTILLFEGYSTSGYEGVLALDGDTWDVQPVSYDIVIFGGRSEPKISPDGTRAVVVEGAQFGDTDYGQRNWLTLYDMTINPTAVDMVESLEITLQSGSVSGDDDSGASFSPDGNWLVYHSNRDTGVYNIFLMDLTTGTPTQLTHSTSANNRRPSFSPDGTRIIFHSDQDNPVYDIYTMNLAGTDLVRLTDGGGIDANFHGVFSPDGQHIVFASDRDRVGQNSDRTYYSQIYLMNTDGSNQRRLTVNSVDCFYPTWSPDSQWIAYTCTQRPVTSSYVISLDGSIDVPLVKPATFKIEPIYTGRALDGMGAGYFSWQRKPQ